MPADVDRSPRRTVLLVEDDLTLLDAFARALGDRHEVVPCSTFEDARRRLREQSFDVLITDVRLGAFNGIQLVLLAKDVNPLTRLIVISGFDDEVLKNETRRLGAVYMVKPVSAHELEVLIDAEP